MARLPLNLQCLAIGHTGFSSSNVQRVASLYNNSQLQSLFCPALQDRSTKPASCRTYATKPVSRPKAHTGRTTTAARKAPTTSKTKAAKKPAPKTTAPKAIPRAKPKAKPRIKAKPKRAKTAKAKPKPRTKKVLTEDQKKTATIRDLRAAALKAPTGSASTAWAVFSQERIKQTNSGGLAALGPAMKEASTAFKNLSPERLEVCFIHRNWNCLD